MAIYNKLIRQISGRIFIETQAEFGSTLAITLTLQEAKTDIKKIDFSFLEINGPREEKTLCYQIVNYNW